MSRKSTFFVSIPDHPEHGYPIEVTPDPNVGGLHYVKAVVTVREPVLARATFTGTAMRNIAGFSNRAWELYSDEVPGGVTQHRTLREAAQELGSRALRHAELVAALTWAQREG